MTTRESFESALDARPDDAATRLMYADWLSDEGHSYESLLNRWMVKHNCFPKDDPQRDWWTEGPQWRPCAIEVTTAVDLMRSEFVHQCSLYFVSRHSAAERRMCEWLMLNAFRHMHDVLLGLPLLEPAFVEYVDDDEMPAISPDAILQDEGT